MPFPDKKKVLGEGGLAPPQSPPTLEPSSKWN